MSDSSLRIRTDSYCADSPCASPTNFTSKDTLASSPLGSPAWHENSARSVLGDVTETLNVLAPIPIGSMDKIVVEKQQPAIVPAVSPTSAAAAVGPDGKVVGPQQNNIQVAIRIRPASSGAAVPVEETENLINPSVDATTNNIWRTSAITNSIEEKSDSTGKQYTYDYICPPEEGTTSLYKNLVRKVVLKSCIGYNSNIFAYGQTASGKTHTILGCNEEPGIVLLSIGDIFHYISQSPTRQFLLRLSCIEVYNEEVNDLLSNTPEGRNLKLENLGGLNKDGTINPSAVTGVKIKGLTTEFVRSPAEFITLLLRAEENRKIASTDANLRSSRSHTMFRIHIESRARADPNNLTEVITTSAKKIRSSLLTFVDLAGSECISQLGGSLERQKECRYINRSLLGLSRVIVKLSEGVEVQNGHVPFRDSKLTRILKPALGGNSHCLFLCCIDSTQENRDESLHTLRFGSFANQINNAPKVNLRSEPGSKEEKEIDRLRAEMERLKAEENEELEKLRLANEELQKKLAGKDAAQLAAEQALADAEKLREAERASKVSSEDEELQRLRCELKLREAQIKILEDKMIPDIEESNRTKRQGELDDLAKISELMNIIQTLRDEIQALEVQRQKEKDDAEALQKKMDAEKDSLLKQLLADKITEAQRYEQRLLKEVDAAQSARILAMQHGMPLLKLCRNKENNIHSIKLWLAQDNTLCWKAIGGSLKNVFGSKQRVLPLRSIERMKLGQNTHCFERLSSGSDYKTREQQERSFSIITSQRSYDFIAPSLEIFDLWCDGLRPLLMSSANSANITAADDVRPSTLKKRMEEKEQQMQQAMQAAANAVSSQSVEIKVEEVKMINQEVVKPVVVEQEEEKSNVIEQQQQKPTVVLA